jgi:hypothetical protein
VERYDPLPPSFAPSIGPAGPFQNAGEPEPKPPQFSPSIGAGGPLQGSDAPRHVPASVEIIQWRGQASNINKHILRDQYTSYQHNMMSVVHGQVQGRGGLLRVYFDGAD